MLYDFSGVLNLSVIQVKPEAQLWYRGRAVKLQ